MRGRTLLRLLYLLMRDVDGWTRDELTDELAAGTGDGECMWREMLADVPKADLAAMIAEADRLRAQGKELE